MKKFKKDGSFELVNIPPPEIDLVKFSFNIDSQIKAYNEHLESEGLPPFAVESDYSDYQEKIRHSIDYRRNKKNMTKDELEKRQVFSTVSNQVYELKDKSDKDENRLSNVQMGLPNLNNLVNRDAARAKSLCPKCKHSLNRKGYESFCSSCNMCSTCGLYAVGACKGCYYSRNYKGKASYYDNLNNKLIKETEDLAESISKYLENDESEIEDNHLYKGLSEF